MGNIEADISVSILGLVDKGLRPKTPDAIISGGV